VGLYLSYFLVYQFVVRELSSRQTDAGLMVVVGVGVGPSLNKSHVSPVGGRSKPEEGGSEVKQMFRQSL
jgi:hypothetical protein